MYILLHSCSPNQPNNTHNYLNQKNICRSFLPFHVSIPHSNTHTVATYSKAKNFQDCFHLQGQEGKTEVKVKQ